MPFHPGELRARRGFVVCQFESGPTAVLVAPPLVRYAEAASSLWMHSDARRGREIEVSVWENLVVTAHQPVSNFHPVNAFGRVVLTGTASAYSGNLNHLYVSSGSYSLGGDSLVVSTSGHAGQNQMYAVVGVYPVGASACLWCFQHHVSQFRCVPWIMITILRIILHSHNSHY